MTLREELQDRADKLDAELLALSRRMREIEHQSDDVHTCINALDIAEMDAQDAALEPIPTPEEINQALDEIEAAEALAQPDVEIPEGFTKWEGGECPVPYGTIVEIMCRNPNVVVGQTNDVFAHMIDWGNGGNPDYNIIAYRILEAPAPEQDAEPTEFISTLTGDPAVEGESGLHGDPEPTELDAPASIVDDPELQAAVARAEAMLAAEPAAYVGLNDPELDDAWDAMKAREEAEKPKPRFSIFGRIKEDA